MNLISLCRKNISGLALSGVAMLFLAGCLISEETIDQQKGLRSGYQDSTQTDTSGKKLEGRVMSSADSLPIAGATVVISFWDYMIDSATGLYLPNCSDTTALYRVGSVSCVPRPHFLDTLLTDQNGLFVWENYNVGKYGIYVSAHSYYSAYADVYLSDTSVTSIHFLLEPVLTPNPSDSDTIINCTNHSQCGDGRYCEWRRYLIECASDTLGCGDPIGVCQSGEPSVLECDESLVTVCGYDGITYPSQCDALNAGTDIRFGGACPSDTLPDTTGCHSDADCDAGQVCMSYDTLGAVGMCIDIMTNNISCTNHSQCDREMHCEWQRNLVECASDTGCGDPIGVCQSGEPSVLECDESLVTVCGYDGITYPSQCDALNAGTDIRFVGACSSDTISDTTGCHSDADCDAGQVCMSYDTLGAVGMCVDLMTNNISCFNHSLCDSEMHCEWQQQMIECPSDTNCANPVGHCAEGAPEMIECSVAPEFQVVVCGYDGITYPSRCAATTAGTVVRFIGACPTKE